MESEKSLVIKVSFKDTTKKFSFQNVETTYDDFVLMLQRVFKGSLTGTDPIVLKYLDEDNDLITISDTDDLKFAISTNDCLTLSIETGVPLQLDKNLNTVISSELKKLQDSISVMCKKLDECSFSHKDSDKATYLPATTAITKVVESHDPHPIQRPQLPHMMPPKARHESTYMSYGDTSVYEAPRPHPSSQPQSFPSRPYYTDPSVQPSGGSHANQLRGQAIPVGYQGQRPPRPLYTPSSFPPSSRTDSGPSQISSTDSIRSFRPEYTSYGRDQSHEIVYSNAPAPSSQGIPQENTPLQRLSSPQMMQPNYPPPHQGPRPQYGYPPQGQPYQNQPPPQLYQPQQSHCQDGSDRPQPSH